MSPSVFSMRTPSGKIKRQELRVYMLQVHAVMIFVDGVESEKLLQHESCSFAISILTARHGCASRKLSIRWSRGWLLLATWFGPLWRFNLAHPLGR